MRHLIPLLAALVLAAHAPATHAAPASEARHAVFVNLADSLQGSFDELTQSLQGGFRGAGWTVLATHDVAVERGACTYHARVLVLDDPQWSDALLARGPLAAFALPVRVLLYEDEAGTHLATVDPHSIARTIVAESGFEGPCDALLRDVVRVASGAVHGRFASRGYGQVRDRGLIGRTMGVMAGGPFPEKVKTIWTSPAGASFATVANQVWSGLQRGGSGRWQVRALCRYDDAARGIAVFGVTGAALEAKSFAIVGAGADDRRSHFRCPGIAHAAAYPIEVVVHRDGNTVRVLAVDGMYRMKMYFEDAGKMKFAANMGMPGSIEDEIRGLVLSGVGAKP